MDSENELAKAKWILAAGLLFLVSSFMCYDELAYLLSGKDATASITSMGQTRSRGRFGMGGSRIAVDYSFSEPDGTFRKDTTKVSSESDIPYAGSGLVKIRYTAGEDGRSRFKGQVGWIWIAIFFASLGGMAFFGYRMRKEANDY